jgi:hypothetical protein
MPLLASTAEALSRETLERGVIEEIISRDDMFAMLPFMQVTGKAYVYDRENSMSGADFLSPNDPVNESASDVTQVTAYLKILAGDVDVDKFLSSTMDDTNNQVAIQIASKAKAVKRMFQGSVVSGNSATNPKQFDGMSRLVDPSQVLPTGTNGAAIAFSMLDSLRDQVILGPDAFVMRRGTWRAIKQLLRSAGGTRSDMLEMENFGWPIPAFDGVPVLLNDFIPNNETMGSNNNTTSIYAVRFNEADGLHGIYGGPSAGMVIEDIGTVQNKDANRIRVKWYAGLCLKSTLSLARLQGVNSAG